MSNKVSALPHFMSLKVAEEEKTGKVMSEPVTSARFMAISTADAFDSTHKCLSGEMRVRTYFFVCMKLHFRVFLVHLI